MPTSGTIAGTMTAAAIITAAVQELGVYSANESVSQADYAVGVRALNWMLKSWDAAGVTSWRDTEGSVAFPAGTATVPLAPYCLDVLSARLVRSATFDMQLQRWERQQYRDLPNKASRGTPTIYVVSKSPTSVTMSLWPVPASAVAVSYSYSRITQDVTSVFETIDIPQEWTEALYLALAVRLASMFGVTRTDPATVRMISQRASMLEQQLLSQDRPASIYMGSAYAYS